MIKKQIKYPNQKRIKEKKDKKEKKKGVIETKHYTQYETDPAFEVAYLQEGPGGKSTGWRESEGKSPEEFIKEVDKTNIHSSDEGGKLAELIKPETKKQIYSEKTYTKKNKRGKEKMSVKLQGTTDRDVDTHTSRSGPSDATITKID